MRSLVIIFSLVVFRFYAQDKEDFTFEIEANRVHYNRMDIYNRYLRDTTEFISSHFGNTYLNDTLKTSFIYGASLSYQPLNFMDLGIYASFQRNGFKRDYQRVEYVGGPPDTYILANNHIKINSFSYVTGIAATLWFNKLFHFDKYNSDFLKRFQVGLAFKAGYSKSCFEETHWRGDYEILTPNGVEPFVINPLTRKVTATNWSGNIEVKLGYRFVEKRFFSGVGLKVGYQFHITPILKNDAKAPLEFSSAKEEMRLNFSGFYYGIYLNFGKRNSD